MCTDAVTKAAERLRAEYGLKPSFVIMTIPFGPEDTVHVMTIRGQEHMMPELPKLTKAFRSPAAAPADMNS